MNSSTRPPETQLFAPEPRELELDGGCGLELLARLELGPRGRRLWPSEGMVAGLFQP